MSIKSIVFFTLLNFLWHASFSQKFFVGAGIENKWTVEQSVYKTTTGLGPSAWVRYKPFKFVSVQTGGSLSFFKIKDDRLKELRMHTLEYKIGFIPSHKFPVSIQIGSLLHFYKYTTNAVYYQELLFLPELTFARKMDGISVGACYPVKKWLDLAITFEKEPFRLWYHSRNSNYLSLQLSYFVGFKRKDKMNSASK
jgi:hypothetical protein